MKKIVLILGIIFICITVAFFIYSKKIPSTKIINEQDIHYLTDMKNLEERLKANSKLIEEINSKYLEKINNEDNEWKNTLEEFENEESKIAEIVENLPVVGIGDSVLLGAKNALYNRFPNGYFDGKVSRTILGGEDVISSLESEGKLGNILILALANNGDYSNKRNTELMELVGERQVYWITAAGADDPTFNEKFRDFAINYPNLHIVEWENITFNHPEYLYGDGVHLREGTATKAYAENIFEYIYNDYLEDFKRKKDELIAEHEEKINKRIAFYGNNVLVNVFSSIYEKLNNALYNSNPEYNFDVAYNELKSKVESNTLENKIVLLFDKTSNISNDEYQKIIDLCQGHEIYICDISNNNLTFENENVKVINFYDEIKKNKDYIIADKIHLSQKGNEEFALTLFGVIDNQE